MSTEISEYSFTVPEDASLKVKNIRGIVRVEPGEADQIHVHATKHLDSGNAEYTVVDVTQDADGLVMAQVKHKDGVLGFLTSSKPCRVDLAITVPAKCEVEIGVVSCEVSVSGIQGGVKLDTVSGDVSLTELTGNLLLNTVSGDITGQRLSGNLDLKAVSGDASLSGTSFPSIRANTVSGDLAIETTLGEGPYKFNSVSGDVILTFPEDVQATVKLSSVSGQIRAPKGTVQKKAKSPGAIQQTAVFNGGGTDVKFSSVSGDLRVIGPAAAAQNELENATEVANTTSRSDILDQIAQGKLSVEEGISQLQKAG